MRSSLAFALVVVAACSASAGESDLVGICIAHQGTITAVAPGSSAAEAGVRVGDRICAIDGFPTSGLHTGQEFFNRVNGAPDTEVDLELEREGAAQRIHVRIRRVARLYGWAGDS